MNEDLHCAEWFVSTLEGDTGPGGLFDPTRTFKPSGAYMDVIPTRAPLPAIRFHVQSSNDVRGVKSPSSRIVTNIDWLVVLVSASNAIAPLLPLADRMDYLLHGAQGETSTLRILACIRLEPFSLLEPDDTGVQYRHAGGMYRTMLQPIE